VRPVGQRIDVLEHAEEVRLRDHQRGEVLAGGGLERAQRRRAAVAGRRDLDQLDALVADDGMHRAR
jgi:hypothetical protein